MESEVHETKSQLAHLRVGRTEVARTHHLLEQILRDALASLVMARKQIQRVALPAPILHDLRGKLDKIPGDVRSSKAADFDAAQAVMQQMSEFVKNSLDFAVGQQGRFAVDRRRQVA